MPKKVRPNDIDFLLIKITSNKGSRNEVHFSPIEIKWNANYVLILDHLWIINLFKKTLKQIRNVFKKTLGGQLSFHLIFRFTVFQILKLYSIQEGVYKKISN